MTSFAYPTLADATAALPTFFGLITGNAPPLADALHDGWVVAGYGASGFTPSAPPITFKSHTEAKQALATHIQAMGMDPAKINWGQWLPIILQILQGLLGGVLGGVGGAGS